MFRCNFATGRVPPAPVYLSSVHFNRQRPIRFDAHSPVAVELKAYLGRIHTSRHFQVKLGLCVAAVKYQIDSRVDLRVAHPLV